MLAAARASASWLCACKQRGARGEHFERRRAAEAVAGGCDAIRFARGRHELVANEDGLPHRGARVRVRRADVLRDLRARVAIRRVELALEVLRLRDVALRVLPVERGQRQRDAGGEQRRARLRVVAAARRS